MLCRLELRPPFLPFPCAGGGLAGCWPVVKQRGERARAPAGRTRGACPFLLFFVLSCQKYASGGRVSERGIKFHRSASRGEMPVDGVPCMDSYWRRSRVCRSLEFSVSADSRSLSAAGPQTPTRSARADDKRKRRLITHTLARDADPAARAQVEPFDLPADRQTLRRERVGRRDQRAADQTTCLLLLLRPQNYRLSPTGHSFASHLPH